MYTIFSLVSQTNFFLNCSAAKLRCKFNYFKIYGFGSNEVTLQVTSLPKGTSPQVEIERSVFYILKTKPNLTN
jgi:hypothetical protein